MGQTDDDWRSGLVLPLHGPFPVDDDSVRTGTVRSQCRLERHLLVLWDRTRKYRDMSDTVEEACSLLFSSRRGGRREREKITGGGGGEERKEEEEKKTDGGGGGADIYIYINRHRGLLLVFQS